MSSAHLTYRPSIKRSRTHTTSTKPMTRPRTISRLAKNSIGCISRFLHTGGGGTGLTAASTPSHRFEGPLPPLPQPPAFHKPDGFENPTLSDHGTAGGGVTARQRTFQKGSISYPVLRSATCESVYECDSENSKRLGFSTPRLSPAVAKEWRAYGEEEQEGLGKSGDLIRDHEEELMITMSRKEGGRSNLTSRSTNSPSPTPPPLPAKSVHWPPRKSSLATEYEYDPNEGSPKSKAKPLPPLNVFSEQEQRRVSISAAMLRAQQRHATFHERDLETWTSFINDSFGSFESSLTLATFDISVPVLTIVDSENDRRASIVGVGTRSPDLTSGGATDARHFSPLTTNGDAISSPRPLSTSSSLFTSALHSGRLSAMLDSTCVFGRPSSFSLSAKSLGNTSTSFPFDVATSTMDESWLFDEDRLPFLSYPFKIEGEVSEPEESSEDQDSITSEWHQEGKDGRTESGGSHQGKKKKQKTTISMMLQWCQNPPLEGYLVDRGSGEFTVSHHDGELEEEDERIFDLGELSDCFDVEVELGACTRRTNRPVSLDAYPFRRMRGDDWSALDRKIRNTI
ncbi:BQ2448_7813 [Microbotryum intermedium]|uniref:BQ2448_7813 protein n=1 Tax=Microbotryum intermedium TaxID=269621 RepID=A0A238FSF3_9BASI|nr:BQ2448_7813 [Microbotryum intermedium]